MKRNALAIIISTVIAASSITVYAETPYLGTFCDFHRKYKDNTYDVYCDSDISAYGDYNSAWRIFKGEHKNEAICERTSNGYQEYRIKVPDSITDEKHGKLYITAIRGSCMLKEFDLNPENKYMKLVDNVVFSKDGKILMSYAQYDDRTVYEIPDGTNIISESAFSSCKNIKQIIIPDSVKEIQYGAFSTCENIKKFLIPDSVMEIQSDAFRGAEKLKEINIPPLAEVLNDTFWYCYELENVYIPENSKLKKIDGGAFQETKVNKLTLPNFEVEISNLAFGKKEIAEKVKLKSYVKPNVYFECDNNVCNLKWDNVANASYYEVYRKKSDGSYKILKTVKGSSIKINGLKNDKKYTFAVKAIAKIKATPYNQDNYIVGFSDLPEYYTIEGTMSDDVTVVG